MAMAYKSIVILNFLLLIFIIFYDMLLNQSFVIVMLLRFIISKPLFQVMNMSQVDLMKSF